MANNYPFDDSKGLKPILLYPTRVSIKMEEEMSPPEKKKAERIFLQQASTARYAKHTALRRG